MTETARQNLIDEMLQQVADRDYDFPVIEDGTILIPISTENPTLEGFTGKVTQAGLLLPPASNLVGYRGYALEINDHGNVTVWDCFKNGNRREVASRV